MSGHDTLRRDGGWSIELINPIDAVAVIDLKPPTLDIVVRWGTNKFPSTLALVSELSGQPESILSRLNYPDVDRVLMALYNIVPQNVKEDLQAGRLPLAVTGGGELTTMEQAPKKSEFPWPESAVDAKQWSREEPKAVDSTNSGEALNVMPREVMRART